MIEHLTDREIRHTVRDVLREERSLTTWLYDNLWILIVVFGLLGGLLGYVIGFGHGQDFARDEMLRQLELISKPSTTYSADPDMPPPRAP